MKLVTVGPVAVLCGVLCLSFIVLASNAAGSATGGAKPGNPPAAHPCTRRLVLVAGGLCCPGKPSSMVPCLDTPRSRDRNVLDRLQPIVVNHVRLPMPIALQMIKAALSRHWSARIADIDQLVCRRSTMSESRVRFLYCNTDGFHFHTHVKASSQKVHCYENCFLTEGDIAITLANYVNADSSRSSILLGLLAQVPGADADYSLREPERVPMTFYSPTGMIKVDFPVYLTFVVRQGSLVNLELKQRTELEGKSRRKHGKKRRTTRTATPQSYEYCAAVGIVC